MPQCTFCQQNVENDAERCPHCGAWLSQRDGAAGSADESLENEVRLQLSQGRKIEAIRIYRERTGMGLAAAKSAVEQLERGGSLPESVTTTPLDADAQLLELLRAGQKIQAIKLYRERTSAGLKEAKDAVEALAARHGIVATRQAGCLGVLAVILISLSGPLAGWIFEKSFR